MHAIYPSTLITQVEEITKEGWEDYDLFIKRLNTRLRELSLSPHTCVLSVSAVGDRTYSIVYSVASTKTLTEQKKE